MNGGLLALLGIATIILVSGCTQNTSQQIGAGLSAMEQQCLKVVDKIESGGTDAQKDLCYGMAAVSRRNESLCLKVDSQLQRDTCYQNLAIVTKDVSLCELILDQAKKNNCYTITAIANKNPALCEKVSDENTPAEVVRMRNGVSYTDSCYSQVADIVGGKGNCDKISYTALKDNCYWHVSIIDNDKNICNSIQDTTKKDDCLADKAPITNSGLGEEAYNTAKRTWGWD